MSTLELTSGHHYECEGHDELERELAALKHDIARHVAITTEQANELAAKQARIDELMFEYCPDEMTPEQIAEWERHQQAVSA